METVTPPGVQGEVIDEQVQRAANELATIVFLSFRFSQGAPRLQEHLLTLAAEITQDTLSPLDTSASVVDLATDKLASMCCGFATSAYHEEIEDGPREIYGKHLKNAKEYIAAEASERLDFYLNTLLHGNRISRTKDHSLNMSLVHILTRDYKNLIDKEEGRPSGKGSDGEIIRSEKDRFASHFVKYILLGKPTSNEVFDRVFVQLQKWLQEIASDPEALEDKLFVLRHVIDKHLAHNPQDLEPLSQQWPMLVPEAA